MADGTILWEGLSALDGITPIVVIATGLRKASKNSKTGKMVQTYILRSDIEPQVAIKLGLDGAICGDCPAREGACYVLAFQGPLNTFKAWERGCYEKAKTDALVGLKVRLGTYGDPAAVPLDVWMRVLAGSSGWTGYTHQWRKCDPGFKYLCMASADTRSEQSLATSQGWRVFRTRLKGEDLLEGEIVCPASNEAGHKTQCADCGLCDGTVGPGDARKNIAIIAHGPVFKVQAYDRMRATIGNGRLQVIQ